MNLTLQCQRCNNAVTTNFIVPRELSLLSNVETMFEQHCNFEVVVSASLQLCIGFTTLTPYRNVVAALCICSGGMVYHSLRVTGLNIREKNFGKLTL